MVQTRIIALILLFSYQSSAEALSRDEFSQSISSRISKADKKLYEAQRVTLLTAAVTQFNNQSTRYLEECQEQLHSGSACYLAAFQMIANGERLLTDLKNEVAVAQTQGLDTKFNLTELSNRLVNSLERFKLSIPSLEKIFLQEAKRSQEKNSATDNHDRVLSRFCNGLNLSLKTELLRAQVRFNGSITKGDLIDVRNYRQQVEDLAVRESIYTQRCKSVGINITPIVNGTLLPMKWQEATLNQQTLIQSACVFLKAKNSNLSDLICSKNKNDNESWDEKLAEVIHAAVR